MHEAIEDGAVAHLCVYLVEGEVHIDLLSGETVEELALGAATALYYGIHNFYKECLDANARPTSIQ